MFSGQLTTPDRFSYHTGHMVAVRLSQGPTLPGFTTSRVHHSQGPPLPGSTTPRVRHSQGPPLPRSFTPRVRHSQGPPLPGPSLYSKSEHIINPTSVSANHYYFNQF